MTLDDDARREIGIDRIGKYLLSGWVLTDATCTRCSIPTMRTKAKDIIGHCVLCDDQDCIPPITQQSLSHTTEFTKDQSEVEKSVSQLLGEKLMQGWTMLAECCDNDTCDGVPLMQSRSKQNYCVACRGDGTLIIAFNNSIANNVEGDLLIKGLEDEVTALNNSTLNLKPDIQTVLLDFMNDDSITSSELGTVKQNLYKKIHWLDSKLAESTNFNEIQEISSAITACINAAKSIN